ncbi:MULTISPECIES: TonB-dependent receptor [unclassified Modicisalibacter]|uniref:TonB-dependent receptor n=1 Tax=unclassified Modicisalibacter TaxID=2679913 RepID=UPI001CD03EC2|nr:MULTISPECIES: TonB-dependent receptor [unclassified Modicisalibacter]MBZ9558531.1 TonB-dependent receptor [Modicisalibacter sp. R2A 31.J]MBZ9575577.1 TonB-dependent receptor [Modicisalibacter sp. MOD 31.J]
MLTVFMTVAAPAVAQDTANESDQISELPTVLVSGEKMNRQLQDTATSVTVLSSENLEKKEGAATVSDVIGNIPNVIITDSPGAPVIRGQDAQGPNFGSTAFFGGTLPRATFNVDGHYLSYYELVYGATSIWDVESIEVFRGPQTVSQGANSIAGAIVVNTKDPTFEKEGAAQLQYGNRNKRRASLAASGPLSDEVAARLSLDYSGRDTFIDYTNPNYSQGKTDPDFEYKNARMKLLWWPSNLGGLEAKLTFSHTQNNSPTWESASAPYEELDNMTTSMPSWKQRGNTLIADVSYDFGNGLQLIEQLQHTNMHVNRVAEPASNGSGSIDQKNLSNEVRLQFGSPDDRVSGFIGNYVAKTDSDDVLHVNGLSQFEDEKTNLGLYGEVAYRFADRWTLTGGLRYQRDDVTRTGTSSYASVPLDFDETFDAWLPKVSLAYEATQNVTLGALVNKGYNPGGINLSFARQDYVAFDEESVWNYELFSRARLLDNRLVVSGNLFYSDYKDSQRQIPDYLNGRQFGSVAVNTEQAKAYGLELSANYQVQERLKINAGVGLLETKLEELSSLGGDTYEGNEFGRAPGYTFNLGADWDITPKIRLSGDLRYTDGYHSTDENAPGYEVDGYTVTNARLTYAPFGHLKLFAFAHNIFDERTPTYLYDDRSVGGKVANMLEPREMGIGVKMTY